MIDVAAKHIHIIGLGAKGTGRACARVLAARGALITVHDEKSAEALTAQVEGLGAGVELRLGAEAYRGLNEADLIVPSPGVPLASPALVEAARAGVPILSEIELAYQFTAAPLLAITGTKGKTTTTTLIGLLLDAAGRKALVGGNIGQPLIELAVEADKNTLLVAEVSSFQLEAVQEFRPRVAVFTNLYPDHLDRYEGLMELYLLAKLNLFRRQTPDDVAIVNADRPESARVEEITPARIIRVSASREIRGGVYIKDGEIISEVLGAPRAIVRLADIRLKGQHNIDNVLEAIAAVEAAGTPVDAVAGEVLANFRGVPNRLEEVDTVAGVTFYNDSQGTTPIAVRMALQAFAPEKPVLIAGGRAKVTDFSELGRDIAAHARALVVIGEAAPAIAAATREADPNFPIHAAPSLPAAVAKAHELALPAGIVVLSPACASFDMFRNMEHRGEVFRKAVAGLKK